MVAMAECTGIVFETHSLSEDNERAWRAAGCRLRSRRRGVGWRLRECDYGDLTGLPAPVVHRAVAGVHDAYPGGESWAAAIRRVGGALNDIHRRWSGRRVLVIGHMSAYWALRHFLDGMSLDEVGKGFEWQEGWELRMCAPADRPALPRHCPPGPGTAPQKQLVPPAAFVAIRALSTWAGDRPTKAREAQLIGFRRRP